MPRYFFPTKGAGRYREPLQSFELAPREAGIHHCNLVKVSSIIPPGRKRLSREKGLAMLEPGQITHVILAKSATSEPYRLLVASVGVAIPEGEGSYGYVSEYHAFGQTDEAAGDYAEDLAATMLATTMGLKFDAERAWDERADHPDDERIPVRHR
jgi:arginine decarboxylase